MLHFIGCGDADIARPDEFLQIRDRDDVVVQAAQACLVGDDPADGLLGARVGVRGDDGLPEVFRRADAVAGQEVVVGGVAIDHAAVHLDGVDVPVALGDVFGLHPDALVEARHLRHDVGHQVGAADVGRVVVHVVGGDQMAAIVAGVHAGIGLRRGLATAAAWQRRVEVEVGGASGGAVIGAEGVFVARGGVLGAVVGEDEAPLVEGDHLGLRCGAEGGEQKDGEKDRESHGFSMMLAGRTKPARTALGRAC